MPRKKLTLLFTSAGRRVELLRAFDRAARDLGIDLRLTATDMDPLAPALSLAQGVHLMPPTAAPEYLPRLLAIAEQEGVDAIFPLIDPDIPVLAANRDKFLALGAQPVVPDKDLVDRTVDKWLTKGLFQDLGLETPESWLPETLPDHPPFPLFLKPRQGSASKGAHRVDDLEELRFYATRVGHPIIQELINGPEITCDLVCGLDGQLLGLCQRRRIEVRWGEVAKGVTLSIPAVEQGLRKLAQELRPRGTITVQCMLKDDRPCFTEINCRFGGGHPLAVAAGVDGPRLLLAELAGLDIELPKPGEYQLGLHMTRFDDSLFLDQSQLDRLDQLGGSGAQ